MSDRAAEVESSAPKRRWPALLLKVFVILLVVGAVAFPFIVQRDSDSLSIGPDAGARDQPLQWRVERGDLTLSSLAPAELRTENSTPVRSAVKTYRQLKIIWIIPEGTQVKKGDKLIELDSSELQEQYLQKKIRLSETEQKVEEAETVLAVAEREYQTNLIMTKNRVDMATIDFEKYKVSDYPQEKRRLESAIAIAREELEIAQEKRKWTELLFEKKFESRERLRADELAVRKSEIALDTASVELEALKEFTYRQRIANLQTSLVEAEGFLDEIRLTGQRAITSKRAALDSAQQRAKLEAMETANLAEQVSQTVINAPEDGLVVYHKERYMMDQSPLKVGAIVNSRQILIDLPNFSSWIVEARIHETMIQQIRLRQRAFIILDAFPDQLLEGTVSKIAVLPNESNWYSETKEYIVEINVGSHQANFKPGMSSKVEIILDELEDVILVPNQVVSVVEGKTYVTVVGEQGFLRQKVTIGESNDQFAQILDGLTVGQEVVLEQALLPRGAVRMRPSDMATEEQRDSAKEASEKAKLTPRDAPPPAEDAKAALLGPDTDVPGQLVIRQ
ncbi:HlyD family efflux transporter periplasmic adaptor subunit [Candidatus Sumerlaeota bacterium]|nr:HlyD family efflux transporter periplasmic adaptor subunit [Candidatus Sumerlaeota bacterium]